MSDSNSFITPTVAPVRMSIGDSLELSNGKAVTLCRGYGKHGAYFFSHLVDGMKIVYGLVTFDTPEDVLSGSNHLLGTPVQVVTKDK